MTDDSKEPVFGPGSNPKIDEAAAVQKGNQLGQELRCVMTDDSKATPRPWRVDDDGTLRHGNSEVSDAVKLISPWTEDAWCGNVEAVANSYLIVAAVNAHDALVAERDKLNAEVARLEKLVYVPGLWRCPKCDFTLVQSNLNALDGTVTARDEPGDKCPNCNGPLWRVTERQAGNDMVERCEKEIIRANEAVAERDRLRQALIEARVQLEYLHSRWRTGSSEQILARIRETLGE